MYIVAAGAAGYLKVKFVCVLFKYILINIETMVRIIECVFFDYTVNSNIIIIQ